MKNLYKIGLISILILSACQNETNKNDKPTVIVTLFPHYDMVRAIAQDNVNLSLLLPSGVEPHAYEPSPRTIININESDLLIYTSNRMETWMSGVFNQLNQNGPVIVDSSKDIKFIKDEDEDDEYDPHYWLDPLNAKIMVENITHGLGEIDPTNADFYRTNANDYLRKLDELDANFVDLFQHVKMNKIIYGGHFAFGYLAARFNIEILSPYAGYSPDAEPSVSSLTELIDTMKQNNINVIFYEELIDPKIARIISEQTGATIEVLHGAHNVSKEEMEEGISYFDIMNNNIAKLKVALNYEQ